MNIQMKKKYYVVLAERIKISEMEVMILEVQAILKSTGGQLIETMKTMGVLVIQAPQAALNEIHRLAGIISILDPQG